MTETETLHMTSQSTERYQWQAVQKSFGGPSLKTKVTLGISAVVGSLLLMGEVTASSVKMAAKVVDGLPYVFFGKGATVLHSFGPILSTITQDAIRDESPIPTQEAFNTAQGVVESLMEYSGHQEIEAYPGENENIIIDFPYGLGRSIVAICAASGGLTVLFHKDGEDLQKFFEHYDLTAKDAFAEILEQLDS